jgi:uncharacterized membrane protein YcgQ (UPF0703/DUF1980 family)
LALRRDLTGATHDVVLRGFVSMTEIAGSNSFLLTRYLISCCAADAQPMSVVILEALSGTYESLR